MRVIFFLATSLVIGCAPPPGGALPSSEVPRPKFSSVPESEPHAIVGLRLLPRGRVTSSDALESTEWTVLIDGLLITLHQTADSSGRVPPQETVLRLAPGVHVVEWAREFSAIVTTIGTSSTNRPDYVGGDGRMRFLETNVRSKGQSDSYRSESPVFSIRAELAAGVEYGLELDTHNLYLLGAQKNQRLSYERGGKPIVSAGPGE